MARKSIEKSSASKTGHPIMAVLDILGRKWSLRILWELHQNGPSSFRTLQRLCGDISPTVLNSRLKELREAGIVDLSTGKGYFISEEGINLGKSISELNVWAKRWSARRATAGKKERS